ncbi:MAG: SDR family oxidoreductase, partial [Pseudomonadota bacterium]
CDVNDKDSIRGAIETASQDGPLTGLAYCVGSINLKPLARCTEQDFMDVYALNVVGAAMAVQMAAVSLKASGAGVVVLFSTVAAQQGFANHALIASAKAGVEGLTVSLAAELAPHIRVNAIAPSLSQTPLATKLLASETMATSLARQHPLQRLGTADDHAALAEFLLAANSGWLTGQIIGVDGGRGTLRMARG